MSDSKKVRTIIVVLLAFVVSLVLSVRELRYAAFGKVVSASVQKVEQQERRGRRGSEAFWYVRYEFDDAGTKRVEIDELPADWQPPAGRSLIDVQYLAGAEGKSRVAGHRNLAPLVMLGVTFLIGVGTIYTLGRKYNV